MSAAPGRRQDGLHQAKHASAGGGAIHAAIATQDFPRKQVGSDYEQVHEFFVVASTYKLRSKDLLHPLTMHPTPELHRLAAKLVAVLLRLQPQRPLAQAVVERDDGAYRRRGIAHWYGPFGAYSCDPARLRLFEEALPITELPQQGLDADTGSRSDIGQHDLQRQPLLGKRDNRV